MVLVRSLENLTKLLNLSYLTKLFLKTAQTSSPPRWSSPEPTSPMMSAAAPTCRSYNRLFNEFLIDRHGSADIPGFHGVPENLENLPGTASGGTRSIPRR